LNIICLDSCDTEKEEEMVEYIANNDLITLGWVHVCPKDQRIMILFFSI
jgi:hypothetical protein